MIVFLCAQVTGTVRASASADTLAPPSQVGKVSEDILYQSVERALSAYEHETTVSQRSLRGAYNFIASELSEAGFGPDVSEFLLEAKGMFWFRRDGYYVVLSEDYEIPGEWRLTERNDPPLVMGDLLNRKDMAGIISFIPTSLRLKYPAPYIPVDELAERLQDISGRAMHDTFLRFLGNPREERFPKPLLTELYLLIKKENQHHLEAVQITNYANQFVMDMSHLDNYVQTGAAFGLRAMIPLIPHLSVPVRRAVVEAMLGTFEKSNSSARLTVLEALGELAESIPHWEEPTRNLIVQSLEEAVGHADGRTRKTADEVLAAVQTGHRRIVRRDDTTYPETATFLASLPERDPLSVVQELSRELNTANRQEKPKVVAKLTAMAETVKNAGWSTRISAIEVFLKMIRSVQTDHYTRDLSAQVLAAYLPRTLDVDATLALTQGPLGIKQGWQITPEESGHALHLLELFLKERMPLERLWVLLQSDKRHELLLRAAVGITLGVDVAGLIREHDDSVALRRALKIALAEKEQILFRDESPLPEGVPVGIREFFSSPALNEALSPHLVVMLSLVSQRLGDKTKANMAEISKLWQITPYMSDGSSLQGESKIFEHVHFLRDRGELAEAKRLLRAMNFAGGAVNRIRAAAIDFVNAVEGANTFQGLGGWIRMEVHGSPGPTNLDIARAYRRFLNGGEEGEIAKLELTHFGYRPRPEDDISPKRMAEVVATTDELIAALNAAFTPGASTSLEQHIGPYEEASGGPFSTAASFVRDYVRDRSTLRNVSALKRLTRVRKQLSEDLKSLSGLPLLQGIILDNALESELYALANTILEDQKERDASLLERINVLRVLMEQMALSGYAIDSFESIQWQLSQLERDFDIKAGSESWLVLHRVVRMIEREINTISQRTIDRYQRVAQVVGERMNVEDKDQKAVREFSSNLLRAEPIFALSRYLNLTKSYVRKITGDAGWEVVVPGKTLGRLKFIEEIREDTEVEPGEIIALNSLPYEFPTMLNAMGILTGKKDGLLTHPVILAREHRIPYAVAPDLERLKALDGKWVYLEVRGHDVVLAEADAPPEEISVDMPQPAPVTLGPADLSRGELVVALDDFQPEWVGMKMARYASIDGDLLPDQMTPESFTIPFGVYKDVLDLPENATTKDEIELLVEELSTASIDKAELKVKLGHLRALIMSIDIPGKELNKIHRQMKKMFGDKPGFLRSSTNAEDLPGYTGAGLYDSYGGIRRRHDVEDAILKIWASVWNDRAFRGRKARTIDHREVRMAVGDLEAVDAAYSFVIHTVDPRTQDPNLAMIEIVEGLGESAVSGALIYQGSPYRMIYDRTAGQLTVQRYGDKVVKTVLGPDGRMVNIRTDYMRDDYILSSEGLAWVRDIVRAGLKLELKFGAPQDIEGAAIQRDTKLQVAFLQSRDQHIDLGEGPATAPLSSDWDAEDASDREMALSL